jgi:ADP-ribose pyrophosphatase YjhB (NUDIX family)
MGEAMTNVFAVVAVVFKDGKILTCSRRGSPADLGLPGGKVDPEETPVEAVMRELREETGIREILSAEHIFTRMGHPTEPHRLCAAFKVLASDVENVCTQEPGVIVRWADPEELCSAQRTFSEYNRRLLAHLNDHYRDEFRRLWEIDEWRTKLGELYEIMHHKLKLTVPDMCRASRAFELEMKATEHHVAARTARENGDPEAEKREDDAYTRLRQEAAKLWAPAIKGV